MPMIIWFAIVMAILMVSGSTAMNIPEIGKDMFKAADAVGTAVLVPIAYAVAVVMVIFAVVFGAKIAKGKDKNDNHK